MNAKPELLVGRLEEISESDLADLCEATETAILDGGGFGWLKPPGRTVLERYWQGVLLVPERELFVARLDGVIAGSAQLVRAPRNNEAGTGNRCSATSGNRGPSSKMRMSSPLSTARRCTNPPRRTRASPR